MPRSSVSVLSFASLLAAAGLILGGCEMRGAPARVAAGENQAENGRLTGENQRLANENVQLRTQLDQAREELRNRSTTSGPGTIGTDLGGLIKGIEGVETTKDGGIALSDDFSFAKGSADLTSEGRKSIEQLAKKLNEGELASASILVEGHTDSTPVSRSSTKEKFVDNWGLSAARAAAVVRELQKAGISATRLHGGFRGEHAPRATGGDAKTDAKANQAKNRRVELRIAH